MSKILALDYGKKRIGIAQTDDKQIIASGLTTITIDKIFNFLNQYIHINSVEKIVVGISKTLSNGYNEIESDINIFVNKISNYFPQISIIRIDERFTSKIAIQSLFLNKIPKKKRRNKNLINEISATIILQSYLYKRYNNIF